MRLIANCPLLGNYGMVKAGDSFEAPDEIAELLIQRGNARKADPPTIVYETQVVEPQETPEVRPERPFRNVHVPDTKPAPVADKSNPKLHKPDVPAKRVADSSQRRRRP